MEHIVIKSASIPDALDKTGSFEHWVYLGVNFARCSNLETIPELTGKRYDSAKPFRDKIESLLPNWYTALHHLLASLPANYRRLSPASECNCFNLPGLRLATLYFLFIDLALSRRNLLFIVDEPRLWNYLLKNHPREIDITFVDATPWPATDAPSNALSSALDLLRERLSTTVPKISDGPITLLQCWANSLNACNGTTLKTYYGELPSFLRTQGEQVIPLFALHVPPANYYETRDLLQRKYPNSLILEDLLTTSDIDHIREIVRGIPGCLPRIVIDNQDITHLFTRIEILGGGWHSVFSLAYFRAMHNLAQQGCTLRKVIYCFENQAWERQLLHGLRTYHPDCKTIGYQHTLPAKHWGFTPPSDISGMLEAPDILLCNGQVAFKAMSPAWASKATVKTGPALRHNYLYTNKVRLHKNMIKYAPLRVGIAASYFIDITSNYLKIIADVVNIHNNIEIVLKLHPVHDIDDFNRFKSIIKIENFSNSHDSHLDFFKKIDLLVGAGTSILTEAVIINVPTYQFNTFHGLNLFYEGIEHQLIFNSNDFNNVLNNYFDKKNNKKYKIEHFFSRSSYDLMNNFV